MMNCKMLILMFLTTSAPAFGQPTVKIPRPKTVAKVSPTTVSEQRPNALSIELAGRGILYSLNYDRSLGSTVSLGAGFSAISAGAQVAMVDVKITVLTFPVFVNFYPIGNNHRPFLTGGITFVSLSIDGDLNEVDENLPTIKNGARGFFPLPILGAGYEYKSDGGFLFRLSPYVTYLENVQLWGGLTLGGTF